MKLRFSSFALLIAAVLALGISACSSVPRMSFTVQRPPDVDVSPYKRIVVAPIESSSMRRNDGALLRNVLIDKLLASRLFNAVSDSPAADGDQSSTLVLSGAMGSSEYRENIVHDEQKVERKVRNPKTKKDTVLKDSIVHNYTLNGSLLLTSQLRLRDAQQNAILWSNSFTIERTAATQAVNNQPAPISKTILETTAIDEMGERLIQSFLIKNERATVDLMEDDDLPLLEKGNEDAKIGQWQTAVSYYNDEMMTHAAHPNIHKAYYNFACVNMALGNYETALRNFDKALQKAPNELAYRNSRALCVSVQADYLRLKKMRGM